MDESSRQSTRTGIRNAFDAIRVVYCLSTPDLSRMLRGLIAVNVMPKRSSRTRATSFVRNARKFCLFRSMNYFLSQRLDSVLLASSGPIEDEVLRYKGEIYHPYHFNCTTCGIELNASARETKDDLYCLKCHEKLNLPICAACRTPIDHERIVYALGKQWHVEVSLL